MTFLLVVRGLAGEHRIRISVGVTVGGFGGHCLTDEMGFWVAYKTISHFVPAGFVLGVLAPSAAGHSLGAGHFSVANK